MFAFQYWLWSSRSAEYTVKTQSRHFTILSNIVPCEHKRVLKYYLTFFSSIIECPVDACVDASVSTDSVLLSDIWRWVVVQKLSGSELVFNNDNQQTIEFWSHFTHTNKHLLCFCTASPQAALLLEACEKELDNSAKYTVDIDVNQCLLLPVV